MLNQHFKLFFQLSGVNLDKASMGMPQHYLQTSLFHNKIQTSIHIHTETRGLCEAKSTGNIKKKNRTQHGDRGLHE